MSKSVSCIIPIYGIVSEESKFFFGQLIQSVASAAKYLADRFELIIVNDDKERISRKFVIDICSDCGFCSDSVLYFENKENLGQAYSRNIGAFNAKYDYLHFIDQDDFISENYYDCIDDKSEDKDIIISVPYFYKNSQIKRAYTRLLIKSYYSAKEIGDLWYLLISNVTYSPGQILISRSAFSRSGGFPILDHKGADDFALFYNLIFKNTHPVSVRFERRCSFYYRIHNSQNSKLTGTNESVMEFLMDRIPTTLKQKIIIRIKDKNACSYFRRLFYLLFFRRA